MAEEMRNMNYGATMNEQMDEARDKASNLIDEGVTEAHRLSDQLKSGKVGRVARQAADKVSQAADYVRDRDTKHMWQDLTSLIRRHPGQALASALILGILAGRSMRRD